MERDLFLVRNETNCCFTKLPVSSIVSNTSCWLCPLPQCNNLVKGVAVIYRSFYSGSTSTQVIYK